MNLTGYIDSNPEVRAAWHFAIKHHEGQMYGEEEYIWHLYDVAEFVLQENQNEEYLQDGVVIALLHDIVEDTEVTVEMIRSEFGDIIANAVDCITKYEGQLYGEYIQIVKSNAYSHIVKIADTLCNLKQSISEHNYERIGKYTHQLNLLMCF